MFLRIICKFIEVIEMKYYFSNSIDHIDDEIKCRWENNLKNMKSLRSKISSYYIINIKWTNFKRKNLNVMK